MTIRTTIFTVLVSLFSFVVSAAETTIVNDQGEGTWTLRSNGTDLLRFRYGTNEKPLVKPYFDVWTTQEGRNILRDAPADHVHHHGLMFAIKVDDVNFWEEYGDFGRQVFVRDSLRSNSSSRTEGNVTRNTASVGCKLDWFGPDGKTLVREDRQVTRLTASDTDFVLLDWVTTLSLPEGKASEKASAKLGGNHYHGLGLRFDGTMDAEGRFFADQDKAQKESVRGSENLAACRWMAYAAKLHGKPVTVAIFGRPGNVRGLLAFTMGGDGKTFAYLSATADLHREPVTLGSDRPLTFRYGIALWEGERSREEVEHAFQAWLKATTKP